MNDAVFKVMIDDIASMKARIEDLEGMVSDDLSFGKAMDMLASGEARKVSCYAVGYDNYVYMGFSELRSMCSSGYSHPFIIRKKDLESIWRVVE